MLYSLGQTLVSKLFQERMLLLGLSRKGLNAWAGKKGFSRQEYLEVSENCWGSRVSRDAFLIRLALGLGADPLQILLAAAADRAPAPYKQFFLAIREGLERYPAMVRDWQAQDVDIRQALLELVGQPQAARGWTKNYRSGMRAHPHPAQVRSR